MPCHRFVDARQKNHSESLGYLGLFVHKGLSRVGWLGTEAIDGSVLGLQRQCLLTHFGWEAWTRISSRNTILLARLALFCVEHVSAGAKIPIVPVEFSPPLTW